jgi:preprotein translocase subunit SecY
MRGFIRTLKNIWSIPELKSRIVNTLMYLLIFRIGSFVLLPGIHSNSLDSQSNASGLAGLIDIFSGGAFSRASIFALGIMPYISASIIMQLMGIAVPTIARMQREGESGRKRINQWTRILTIGICLVQAPGYLATMVPADAKTPGFSPWLAVFVLMAGTMFIMWLGEKITDKGIGNGISLLIMVGIIAKLPAAFLQEFAARNQSGGFVILLLEIVMLLLVIVFSIMLVQGTRRIPLQFAKRIQGNKQYGGNRSYLPLKVNSAGVMPIIFAQALMFIPSYIALATQTQWLNMNPFGFWYNFFFAILIIVFTYFYTAIVFNPQSMAEEMKRNNAFIPGVKPGKQTQEYIDSLISKITLPGSIFLAGVAILPTFAQMIGIKQAFAYFYGGTSLLIMVGVVLDTLQQIETHLINKKYDGLMKEGRIKGRGTAMPAVAQ